MHTCVQDLPGMIVLHEITSFCQRVVIKQPIMFSKDRAIRVWVEQAGRTPFFSIYSSVAVHSFRIPAFLWHGGVGNRTRVTHSAEFWTSKVRA